MKYLLLITLFFSLNSYAEKGGLYGSLSIVPGLGQVASGNYLEGAFWLTSVAATFSSKSSYTRHIGFDLWMYNMYDAYRDANNSKSTFVGEYASSFNPLNAFDWIGTPVLAVGSTSLKSNRVTASSVFEMSFVGLSEEGLFRGFLFPSFTSSFNSKWAAAIVSSGIFAIVHFDGSGKIPMRFIMGMLFCWQADNNKYDLGKNIFTHTWWDVMVASKTAKIDGLKFKYDIDF